MSTLCGRHLRMRVRSPRLRLVPELDNERLKGYIRSVAPVTPVRLLYLTNPQFHRSPLLTMNCTNQLVTTMIDSNATSDAAIAVVETLVNTTVEVATNTTTAAVAVATALLPLTQLAMAFEPLIGNGYIQNSLNFLFFGTVLETGRRLWNWIMDQFTGGQSAYLQN